MAGVKGKMSGLRHLISFEEATSRVKDIPWRKISIIEVDVESSMDMVIAEDVKAGKDVPAYDRSAVDGFALRRRDVSGASAENPVSLTVTGSSGFEGSSRIERGTCSEINTGARLPPGADAVIMAEYASLYGDTLFVEQSARIWENVSRKGEDIASGKRIIARGDVIKSWHVAAMIAVGRQRVKVYRRINLGVISTGNEIVPGSLSGIRNTTQPLLINYFRQGHINTTNEGVCPDEYDAIKKGVQNALENVDILVVTGGSSIGRSDYSAAVLSDIGKQVFRGVMIKPGRTIALFEINGKPVFSVSGLPVAALTSFEAFFDRFMIDILEYNDSRQVIRARLTERLINNGGMRSFVRIALSRSTDSLDATPLRSTGSGMISTLLMSNGLAVVPESVEGMEKGEYVWVTLTGGTV